MIRGMLPLSQYYNAPRPERYSRNDFLKAIGLEAFFLFGSKQDELPKPIYSSSFKTGLARSAVHWLPASLSIIMISVNLRHLFLGRQYTGYILSQTANTALLQVASKLHEMTVIASLTNVVLNIIRRELSHGPGVPLGAISGAFTFSSLSYSWSPDFWGALVSDTPKWSKAKLYSILLLCMLLSATVGPSAAILMIPRQQQWLAGGAKLWLRGTYQDIYPTILPRNDDIQAAICLQSNATSYPICPSGAYAGLVEQATKDRFDIQTTNEYQKQYYSIITNNPRDLLLPAGLNGVESMIVKWSFRGQECQTGAVAGRLSEALRLASFSLDFNYEAGKVSYLADDPSTSEYRNRGGLFVESATQVPSVKTACSDAYNISDSHTGVHFPILKQNDCWFSAVDIFNVDTLNQTQSSRLRTSWTTLPSAFGPTSTGFILEGPWDSFSRSRLVVGCSISAGWSNGTITDPDTEWLYRGVPKFNPPWNRSYDGSHYSNIADTDMSWQRISFGEQWLKMLAPSVDSGTNDSATTLEVILESSAMMSNLLDPNHSQVEIWNNGIGDQRNRTVMTESILAVVLADALSREGSHNVLSADINSHWRYWSLRDIDRNDDFGMRLYHNRVPYVQPSSGPLIFLQATPTVTGLAYMAKETTDFIAIGILLVHVLIALCHTVYILLLGESSGSWHTITELLTLALNSQSAQTALRNTSAGIKEPSTYSQVAHIRAVEVIDHNKISPPKVSLVFREDDSETLHDERLVDENSNSSFSKANEGIHSHVQEAPKYRPVIRTGIQTRKNIRVNQSYQ